MKFNLVINSNIELAETPVWDDRLQKLYWTDLFSGDVHLFDPATGEDKFWKTNKIIGSAIPCEQLGKVFVMAQMLGAVVRRWSSTLTAPRGVSSTPAASGCRSCRLGRRPVATSTASPSAVCWAPFWV